MSESNRHWRQAQMGLALTITAAIVAAFWIGGSLEWAIPAAILMLGFIAAMALRDRSQTAETLYGVGDERTRRLHQRTAALAGLVMLAVIVTWYLVTIAQGDPNETLGLLAVIFNATLIASGGHRQPPRLKDVTSACGSAETPCHCGTGARPPAPGRCGDRPAGPACQLPRRPVRRIAGSRRPTRP